MSPSADTERHDDWIVVELEEMLSQLEGPPTPAAPPSPGEGRGGRRGIVLAFAALVAVGTLAAVLAIVRAGEDNSSGGCVARLVFGGRPYEAIGVARGSFALGENLGEAIQPGCADSITESDDGGVTVEGSPDRTVPVRALAGVDPRVAISWPEDAGGVYVLAGRCAGLSESAFLDCLRSPLTYRGQLYVATRLRTPTVRERFILADRLGEGDLRGASIPVFRIEGIDPAVAIGRPGDSSRIYIADGRCLSTQAAELARCVRAGEAPAG